MLAELHCHTKFSNRGRRFLEGFTSPACMVECAKRRGLGALAITDHDSVEGIGEAKKAAKEAGIIFIPGCEVTSASGHILALGISEAIPKRISVAEVVDDIHSQGGIAVAAHPFDVGGVRKKAMMCDAIEVFNAMNVEHISNWKAERFAKKTGLPRTAASDAHTPDMLGHGRTCFDDSIDDMDKLLRAIRNGRLSIEGRYVSLEKVAEWNNRRLENLFISHSRSECGINALDASPRYFISRSRILSKMSGMLAWPFTCGQLSYKALRIAIGI